jgi:hypothetical protein
VYADPVPDPASKLATVFGLVCVAIGIAWGFLASSANPRFSFAADDSGLFLIILLVGVLLSLVGAIAWARHLRSGLRLKVAGCLVVMGLLVFAVVPNNVHGPGMLIVLVVLSAWALSIILVLMAFLGKDESAN